jgi:hypothetical protein
MPESVLPAPVGAFLREFIFSVEQLEILLLVSGAPQTAWTPSAVYDIILSTPASVAQRLEFYAGRGFLTRDVDPIRYYWAPTTPGHREIVSQLAHLYRTRPVLIIEAIFSRDRAAHSFADAFKLKPQ